MGTTEDSQTGVARELADVARQLHEEDSPRETWQRIVDLAVQKLDDCQFAGVTLIHSDGRVETPVITDEVVRLVDTIQLETGQGPCLDAIREAEVFSTGDLGQDSRWPDFAGRAEAETGIRSMLAFRLFVQEETLGALNLYSRDFDAFDEHDKTIGSLFAAHAALAMSHAAQRQHGEQMEAALDSSRVIGMALGILMEQSGVDRHRAFDILSMASQRNNVKLRELAETLVAGVEARQPNAPQPELPS
jgi:putative methionine-R-sulfoxide reductase with GAF domain